MVTNTRIPWKENEENPRLDSSIMKRENLCPWRRLRDVGENQGLLIDGSCTANGIEINVG